MDFSLSAEQRELKEAAIAFARAKLNQDLAKREEAGEFSAEAWRACARFGIQGLPVPAELGGGGSRHPDDGPGHGGAGIRLSRQRADLLAQRADVEP